MITDLLIKMPENAADDFTINLLFMTDDNFVAQARHKTFPGPFRATRLETYLEDWAAWDALGSEDLAEIRRVRGAG